MPTEDSEEEMPALRVNFDMTLKTLLREAKFYEKQAVSIAARQRRCTTSRSSTRRRWTRSICWKARGANEFIADVEAKLARMFGIVSTMMAAVATMRRELVAFRQVGLCERKNKRSRLTRWPRA